MDDDDDDDYGQRGREKHATPTMSRSDNCLGVQVLLMMMLFVAATKSPIFGERGARVEQD